MKVKYIDKNFSSSSLEIIKQADLIINEYQSDGLDLTLRQLYYQFVSRDLIANKQSEYKRLGTIINDARLAGLLDWDAIEDRTRNLKKLTHWENPGHIMSAVRNNFRLDHWRGQVYYPEVWIEKEALTGVISTICEKLDVSYFACRGYVSQSEMWRASNRLIDHFNYGQTPIIIHLGDHDPSGVDMTRDIIDRQELFAPGEDVKVIRIALNMDQVDKYNPPPNPAKLTDSRCESYIAEFGDESWELDALEPRVIRELIEDIVLNYRDDDVYQGIINQENEYRKILKNIEENWESL